MMIGFTYLRPWVWFAGGVLMGCVAGGAWVYFTDLRDIHRLLAAQTAALQRLEARVVRTETPFEAQQQPLAEAFAHVYQNAGETRAAAQTMGAAAAQHYMDAARRNRSAQRRSSRSC